MKKRIFSLLVLLIISVFVCAQAPEWQWATQAGGDSGDFGFGITVDNAGNTYVTGFFNGTATFGSYSLSGYGDIFVAKMDANGNWLWATQAGGGGTSGDFGFGITVDDAGNSYVIGSFHGTATFGFYSLPSSGYEDIFVAKLNATGNWLWATQAGGTSNDRGYGITIDDAGNSYVTGGFQGTATFGSYYLTSSSIDIFVAKMDEDGNWLWVTQAGGTESSFGHGITIDNEGNSYVTGYFRDTATFGSHSLTSNGNADIFVAKMDANGNWLWATQSGGGGYDEGNGITIDDTGNSYVTGTFDYTATFSSYSLYSNGSWDIFVAKMDTDGNWLWATNAGGTSNDRGYGITIDDAGYTYVTGRIQDTATFGSYTLPCYGYADIIVAKMDSIGNWIWATRAGGTYDGYYGDSGKGITIDDAGNSYVTGYFQGTAFFGYYSISGSGYEDIFVAKLGNETSFENEIIELNSISLSNYPNPFNPTTMIYFETTNLHENSRIEIFNIKGQKVKQFSDIRGQHSVVWNGKDDKGKSVSSGIYFYRLESGDFSEIKKMILLR